MQTSNLLPFNGCLIYNLNFLTNEQSDFYFKEFYDNIDWKQDELIMFGKKIITKRKVAWFGDENFEYTYSKATKKADIWTNELKNLKSILENETKETFNSCLLNLYPTGNQGMGWHADNEKELKKQGAIASISLGATRKFVFKHKTNNQKVNILLENGSLLLMKQEIQDYWLHSLPKTKKIISPRINLTFRTII